MNEFNTIPNITRSSPIEWMDLLWDIIWDYEDCKERNGEIKNHEAFRQMMDEVKTIMAWIEEDLGIERDMYKLDGIDD